MLLTSLRKFYLQNLEITGATSRPSCINVGGEEKHLFLHWAEEPRVYMLS